MWQESPGGQSAALWQTGCSLPQPGMQLVPLALLPQHMVPGIDEHPALEVQVTMGPVPPLLEPDPLTMLPLDPVELPLGIPPELPLVPPL
jgi:hypothetical protein